MPQLAISARGAAKFLASVESFNAEILKLCRGFQRGAFELRPFGPSGRDSRQRGCEQGREADKRQYSPIFGEIPKKRPMS